MVRPITLRAQETLTLQPRAPFNFDATLHKPDHFPSADTAWEPGVRWQTMRWQGRLLGLKFEDRGTTGHPRIALTVWSQRPLPAEYVAGLRAEIQYRYSLGLDLRDFNRRGAQDPELAPILRRWRGLRPACYSSLYEYLIIAIVLQNATVRRSVQMMQTLFESYGTPLAYDGRELYAFWQPGELETVSEAELRALKVGYRAKSIKRVTNAFTGGEIDEMALRARPREEQREALLGLYGIGPASVGYILGDVFHHLDEMEYISPWEQRIYSAVFCGRTTEDPAPVAELLEMFETRFGPYKGLAVHYVWEDLFWRHKRRPIDWLAPLIRL